MKKLTLILALFFVFSLPVCAQSNYESQYENLGISSLKSALDEETLEFFEQNDIDAKNPNWVNNLSSKGVIAHIWRFITSGAKTPIKTGVLIASIIFLSAALATFSAQTRIEIALYAAVFSIATLVSVNVFDSVLAAVSAVKGCSTFMISFVPVFTAILALSGKTVTSGAMNALLLGAAEVVSSVSSFVVLPLMGGYLALSISSSVSPLSNGWSMVESVKKLSTWIITLISTLFIGILGIQTAVNSAADSITLRTAKFILGTSVPVVGGALSEAVSTISASMELLRTSIGVYGVTALLFMLLPMVIELVLWRIVLMLNISLGELFSLNKITGMLKALDSMLGLLIGVILMVGGMFIISLTVVVTIGKG